MNLKEFLVSFLIISLSALPQAEGRDAGNNCRSCFHMPEYGSGQPPPERSTAEVQAVLGEAPALSHSPPRPLNILLVAGKKDHGPGEHDYPAWLEAWAPYLETAEGVAVDTAMEWPAPGQFAAADAVVFYQKGSWDDRRARDIDAFLERGGGLTYIHFAVAGAENSEAFAERIGLAGKWPPARYRHGELAVTFNQSGPHPIARNFDKTNFIDESYWKLTGDPAAIHVFGTTIEDDRPRPLFWTVDHKPGRVFVSIPGHYSWTFDDPLFRLLLLRGIAWSAGEPVDRFNKLVRGMLIPTHRH